MRHSLIRFLPTCLVLAALTLPASAQPDEIRLKAAFVSRFPEFVEWPASTAGSTVLEICVLGRRSFSDALATLTAGTKVGDRSVAVRHIEINDEVDSCRLMFFGGALAAGEIELLRRIAVLPILSVGDAPDFLDRGGIIALKVVNRRIRFDIAADAAERARLRLSSQLLQLAVAVRGVR